MKRILLENDATCEIELILSNGRISIQMKCVAKREILLSVCVCAEDVFKMPNKNTDEVTQLKFICIAYVDIFSERGGNNKHELNVKMVIVCNFMSV